MNGWQRMGLVAFVIWALVAFVVSWLDFNHSQHKLHEGWLTGCRSSYDAARPGQEAAAYERCFKETGDRFQAEFEVAIQGFWQFLPFVILVPALLAWALISLTIVAVRWIRKGFMNRPAAQ
jgi:hypothetical protein